MHSCMPHVAPDYCERLRKLTAEQYIFLTYSFKDISLLDYLLSLCGSFITITIFVLQTPQI